MRLTRITSKDDGLYCPTINQEADIYTSTSDQDHDDRTLGSCVMSVNECKRQFSEVSQPWGKKYERKELLCDGLTFDDFFS